MTTRRTASTPMTIYLVLLVLLAIADQAAAFVPHQRHTFRPGTTARFYANDCPASNSVFEHAQEQRKEWLDRSIEYYSKVAREERRRKIGQIKNYESAEYQDDFLVQAKKHYFALRKIKDGKPRQAERIYRRIIDELVQDDTEEEGGCDHAKLAITTLLLALLLQRIGSPKEARSVFLHFFRVAVVDREEGTECACSAKVLQAYALFEMKQGNSLKSLSLVQKAVELDPTLEPVLQWKQFRDVLERSSTQ